MNDSDPGLETPSRLQRPMPQRQAPLRRPPLGLPATADLPGFVERGVDTAYTVIEAYLQRGQQAAQRLAPGAPGSVGGLGSLGASPSSATPWAPGAAFSAGPWLQLLRAWADAVATLGPLAGRVGAGLGAGLPPGFMAAGGAAPMATAASTAPGTTATASPSPLAPSQAAGPRAKVTLELLSPRSAEVAVSLEPGADLAALQADWLPAQDGATARAPGSLQLYSEPGHVHLRLALVEPPPPGRHEARLTDPQGQAWGTVVVTVAPQAPSHPATHPAANPAAH